MKFKSLLMAGLALWTVAAVSCSDDPEYTPAEPVATPQAYFNPAAQYDFELGEDDTEVTVYACRAEGKGELTVSLTSESNLAGGFTVPASVTFADGETTAPITIGLNNSVMEGAVDYTLNLILGDGKDTPYFNLTLPVGFVFFPWNDVLGPNGEEYATYTDDFVTTWFNVDNISYPVKLQSSPAIKGLYRLVNPYGAAYPYNEPGDYDDSTNHYMYINCADPNKVFLCNAKGEANVDKEMAVFNTGMDWSYGEFIFTGLYNLRMAQGDAAAALPNAGKLVKGVITFPERALLGRMDEYTAPGNWSYGNTNGAFKLVFPGVVEEVDPLDTWAALGEADYTDCMVYPLYNQNPVTYKVAIEQYQKDTNLYRLVNPYKKDVMPNGADYEGDKYIVIDVTNPDCVIIPDLTESGWVDEKDGELYMINLGGFYTSYSGQYTEEQVISAGLNDTFKDGVITFGAGHMAGAFPNSPDEETSKSLLLPTLKVEGKIVLPAAAGEETNAKVNSVTSNWIPADFNKTITSYKKVASLNNEISIVTKKLERR